MQREHLEQDKIRDRAAREIALAAATGAKAFASADHKTVFVVRRDGTREKISILDGARKLD